MTFYTISSPENLAMVCNQSRTVPNDKKTSHLASALAPGLRDGHGDTVLPQSARGGCYGKLEGSGLGFQCHYPGVLWHPGFQGLGAGLGGRSEALQTGISWSESQAWHRLCSSYFTRADRLPPEVWA